MRVQRAEALTLRTYPYSEAHRIVVFLTRSLGKLRAMAHGAKGRRSRFGSSLEPLTHCQVAFARRENQELATLKQTEILRAFPAYQLSWEINLHFAYFAELLQEFSREEEEAEHLFRLALAILHNLDKPIGLLARYLEFWLLRLEGVLPPLEQHLPAELAGRVGGWLRSHPRNLDVDLIGATELRRLESLSEQLIECHLEKRLKSKKMLKELLTKSTGRLPEAGRR